LLGRISQRAQRPESFAAIFIGFLSYMIYITVAAYSNLLFCDLEQQKKNKMIHSSFKKLTSSFVHIATLVLNYCLFWLLIASGKALKFTGNDTKFQWQAHC
jgi:hypothetical protein